MTIADIAAYLESFAPLSLQEDYDNAGLITGNPSWECTGILCTLDVTDEVVAEAVSRNLNCIVAHHPIIFRGLKKINGSDMVEKTVIAAIKNDIAIYAAHTNLDNIISGVNGRIAAKLGMRSLEVLSPSLNSGVNGTGSGLTGEIDALTATEFLSLLRLTFGSPAIRHTAPGEGSRKTIRKVAVCGGAGSFLIPKALAAGADAYITSDIKYHEFFGAEGRMLLCDIGHYESEQFTTDLFIEILLQKFPTFAVLKSEIKTNPVNYFTEK